MSSAVRSHEEALKRASRVNDAMRHAPQVAWLLLAIAVGFLVLWPLVQLEALVFTDFGAAIKRMIVFPRFWRTLGTTVLLAVASTVLAVIIGVCLAWCATLLPRRVRRIGQLLPFLPLLIPAVAAVIGWIFLLSPRVGYLNTALRSLPGMQHLRDGPIDVFTVPWIIVITALLLSSFVYLFVLSSLQSMGQDLDSAAAASGASPLRVLFTVTLPLTKPAIVMATGVVFLLGMGQFTAPLLLGRSTGTNVLTTEMFNLTLNYPVDYGLGAALGLPILVAGFAVVLLQKFAVGDQRRYVVVSARSGNQARETRWWAAAVIAIYALLTTILPLLALIYVSLSSFWSGSVSFDKLTLQHWRDVFRDPLIMRAIWTSIKVSFIAVAILLVAGFACAFALLQSSKVARPIRVALDFFVSVPLAIPATLMGFGFLFAYSGPPIPLYGTAAVLIVAYVTLMIGYATRLLFTTLVATGQEFREASKACGAGPIRTFLLVMLPMARRGLGAAAALTFVMLFHEFSASLMVKSPTTQVIGSVMYDIWTAATYPQVAVLALIMALVTIFGVAAAAWLGGTDGLQPQQKVSNDA